jgi:excisionase family DNA binding protein
MRQSTTDDRQTPRMIDVNEVAMILDVSTRTVWRLAASRELPQPVRFGRNVRWRIRDIEAWIEKRLQ